MSQASAAFIGAMPEQYDNYLGPAIFEPYAVDLAARLGLEAGDLLEIAAGTGIVTRALERTLPPEVRIVSTDLNQPMLDRAARRLSSDRVTWKQADAQALPFEDGSFDAAVCQFGVMFFPDRSGAYREVFRVLRPGGEFVFNVWDKIEYNGFAHAVSQAVAERFRADPPGFMARTPHGYNDVEEITMELSGAGFVGMRIETVTQQSRAPSHRDPAIGFCQGSPMRAEIEARDPEGLAATTEAAAQAIAARCGTGPVQARMQAHVVSARRP